MSNPQNILGRFDTYAYHHILMVCNSTDTAEALSRIDEITTFQHPRNQVRYSARDVEGINGESTGYHRLLAKHDAQIKPVAVGNILMYVAGDQSSAL